ncbi:MAG TPA: OmpW family outer membrane protein [Rhodanobacteraceae bacterium]
MKALPAAIAACFALAAAPHARAEDPWTFRFGIHDVSPKSGNGSLAGGALKADLDDSVRPTASIEYLFTPNLGIDLLAAWPFEHTLKLNGAKAATLKQLPPTLGLNWHFMPEAAFSPFVGVGVNFTKVFDEKTTGPLAGADLSIGDSWGLAAHAGFDVTLSPKWLLTADVRWMDIDSSVRVNGTGVGTVNVDPWVFGVSAGYRF